MILCVKLLIAHVAAVKICAIKEGMEIIIISI